MEPDNAARRSAIEQALLDYHRSPGKYAQVRRQPSLLYASIRDVLLLASGRATHGDGVSPRGVALQQAASFFIRNAMLFPDADHYALLGLEHGADATAVKDRYRQMMRLMHPDFSSALAAARWPTDAAARVNQAYEVLSSPVQRRGYDEQFEPPAPARPGNADIRSAGARNATARSVPSLTKAPPEDPRRRLKGLATVFGTAGGLALLAVWMANGQGDRESLVQRVAPASPATTTATATAKQEQVVVASVPATPQEVSGAMPSAAPVPMPIRAPVPAHLAAVAVVLPPPAEPVAAVSQRPMIARTPVSVEPPVQLATTAMATPKVIAADVIPRPEPAPAPAPSVALSVAALPLPAPAPSVASAPARREPAIPGPTLADVHPLLARLLQELESGWGDRVVSLLDRDARSQPSAQALLLHYNGLVDGMRPVQLTNVQFKAEPRDGRLLVTGHVLMQVRDRAVAPRELAVQAEFAARDGAVIMTRLSRARE